MVGSPPLSISARISLNRRVRSRLTTKPGVSATGTAVLPNRSARSPAVKMAASDVNGVRTSSTSGRTGTGLKKWNPSTLSGCLSARVIPVTESEDVLVSRSASGAMESSNCRNTVRFVFWSSKTASMAASHPLNREGSVVPRISPAISAASPGWSLPRDSCRSRCPRIRLRAADTRSAERSLMRTGTRSWSATNTTS